jgi:hypothetical protein
MRAPAKARIRVFFLLCQMDPEAQVSMLSSWVQRPPVGGRLDHTALSFTHDDKYVKRSNGAHRQDIFLLSAGLQSNSTPQNLAHLSEYSGDTPEQLPDWLRILLISCNYFRVPPMAP